MEHFAKGDDPMNATLQEYAAVLQSCALFSGMEPAHLEEALNVSEITLERFGGGELLMSRVNPRRTLGILLKGHARVLKGNSAKGVIMSVLSPGHLFGAAALFTGTQRYESAIQAMQPCIALMIPEDILTCWIDRFPQIRQNYLTYLSDRIRFLSQRIDSLAGGNVRQRLAAYLYDNRLEQNGQSFVPDVNRSRLATLLGIGRTSLYRALEELEALGAIQNRERSIVLTNIPKLLWDESTRR